MKKVEIIMSKKILITLLISFILVVLDSNSFSKEKLLFDLNEVANKSPEVLEKFLGKPSELKDGTFKGTRGITFKVKRGKYKNGLIEITFIENGARYITIYPKHDKYKYPDDAWTLLGEIGLDKNATASFSNKFVTRWKNLSGIYEINVFPISNKVQYVHILTDKKYE